MVTLKVNQMIPFFLSRRFVVFHNMMQYGPDYMPTRDWDWNNSLKMMHTSEISHLFALSTPLDDFQVIQHCSNVYLRHTWCSLGVCT